MNIGSLIRGLLGEQKAGESKTLDMKPGQVVRGVVMNVSEDGQEAVVQIQGVQVKAKLETPLKAGETALLQVQPLAEGDEGAVVLKPLQASPNQTLNPSSMLEVLEYASLPDTKENREMIRGMQMVGIPLTKENIAQFKEVLASKPVSVPLNEWIESSAIAFHRGLPITAESIKGLQQAVFGPQLHELLQTLENQLGEALQGSQANAGKGQAMQAGQSGQAMEAAGFSSAAASGVKNEAANTAVMNAAGADEASGGAVQQAGAGDGSPRAAAAASGGQQALLAKLQSLLTLLRGELAQQAPWAGSTAPPAPGAAGGFAAPAAGQAAVASGSAAESAPPPLAQAALEPPTHAAEPWVGRLLKLLGAEHEQQVLRGGAQPAAQQAGGANGGSAQSPASSAAASLPSSPNSPVGEGAGLNIAAGGSQRAAAMSAAQGTPAAGGDRSGAPPAFQAAQNSVPEAGGSQATTVGANMASSTAQAPNSAQPANPSIHGQAANHVQNSFGNAAAAAILSEQTNPELGSSQPFTSTVGAANDSNPADIKETLKGLLLQLAASSDVPPALKEAAGQLIQHMTGQQLLLNTDRTAPFAQVTMFIPFHGPDGEQTASVHIQSRRGRKGELDPTNCRLWFDLDMKALGPTVIDVQVVDRIVSLDLRNDQPWVTELFKARKNELAAGVESIGYQLLSMKTSPFPQISSDAGSGIDLSAGSTASEYTPQVYKGVDYRI